MQSSNRFFKASATGTYWANHPLKVSGHLSRATCVARLLDHAQAPSPGDGHALNAGPAIRLGVVGIAAVTSRR